MESAEEALEARQAVAWVAGPFAYAAASSSAADWASGTRVPPEEACTFDFGTVDASLSSVGRGFAAALGLASVGACVAAVEAAAAPFVDVVGSGLMEIGPAMMLDETLIACLQMLVVWAAAAAAVGVAVDAMTAAAAFDEAE